MKSIRGVMNRFMCYSKTSLLIFILTLFLSTVTKGQSNDSIITLLLKKGMISQQEADSLINKSTISKAKPSQPFYVEASKYIKLAGYAQFRYQSFEDSKKNDGFDVRRARLDLRSNITEYLGFRLQSDLSGSFKLLDAYAEVKLLKQLNFTVGQFKIPFSLQNLESSNKMFFIDRSQVVEALVSRSKDVIGNQNGRDIGVQASGVFLSSNKEPIIEYRIGIFNGSGINVADTSNSAKDIIGRIVFTPVKGLSVGASYLNGRAKFGKPLANHERERLGFELQYTNRLLNVQSEYIQGKDGSINRKGWYGEVGYFAIPQKLQGLFRYDSYDANIDVSGNITNAYSFGLAYYINKQAKLQAVYTINTEQQNKKNNNLTAIQFTIGF